MIFLKTPRYDSRLLRGYTRCPPPECIFAHNSYFYIRGHSNNTFSILFHYKNPKERSNFFWGRGRGGEVTIFLKSFVPSSPPSTAIRFKSLVPMNLGKCRPWTFGDRWQPMTIQPDLKIGIGYRCHQVTNANFAFGDRNIIGYTTDTTDGT